MKRRDNSVLRPFSFDGDSGSSLVEYAIIFTIFITMLLAIADFSRAVYAYHFVSSQARETARYAIVRGASCTGLPDCDATAAQVKAFAKNVPLGIDASKVTATPTWTPDNHPGSVVSVEVDYTFSFLFPFVSKSTLTMKSTSQMVISQ